MTPEQLQRLSDLERNQSEVMAQLRDTKHKLANTTQQLSNVISQNEKLNKQLESVLLALEGNKLTKEPGIIDRLIAQEKFMEWIKQKRTVLTGWFLGVSFVAGVVASVFWGLIKLIQFLKSMH